MRTAIIRISVLLLAIGAAAAAQQIAPQSDATCGVAQSTTVNWSQFHFDPCHTGYNPDETTLNPSNVGELVLDWKDQQLGEEAYNSPAVVDSVVYFGSTSGDGYVYAVDAHTGNWRWQNRCGALDNSAGSPAAAFGRVYAACGNGVRAFNAATGQLLWETRDVLIPQGEITVVDGSVFVASHNMGMAHYARMSAFDAGTGVTIWELEMEDWVFSTPTVANGVVYAGCDSRSLCALDAGTGVLLWKYTAAVGDLLAAPAVSDGVVYFRASNTVLSYVYALNALTGELVWQRPIGTPISILNQGSSTLAVANGVLYTGSGSADGRGDLSAVNANTGAPMWSYKAAGRIDSSPAVANGVIYFGSYNQDLTGFSGDLYALDAEKGALLWKYHTENPVESSPAVVNGSLYVGSLGYMYAFHPPGQ